MADLLIAKCRYVALPAAFHAGFCNRLASSPTYLTLSYKVGKTLDIAECTSAAGTPCR